MRSANNSAFPPTVVATTGRPVAMASRMVLEMPSANDGSANASMLERRHHVVAAVAGQPRECRDAGGPQRLLDGGPRRTITGDDESHVPAGGGLAVRAPERKRVQE